VANVANPFDPDNDKSLRKVFQARCQAAALRVGAHPDGRKLQDEVDRLWNWAVGRGLDQELGVDAVQAIMAAAFSERRDL
jgi:hypothetical protein